jgi:hypothetical protein
MELQRILETNRLSWLQPLSPAAYEAWTNLQPEKTQTVRPATLPNGEDGLRLATVISASSGPGAVLDSEWVVRTKDWHPVQHRIRVNSREGFDTYEITELAYDVIGPSNLPRSLFAEVEPSGAPPSSQLRPARLLEGPSVADLRAAEIKAHYALHRLKVCLGEPIEVVRGMGQIEVRGLARDEERKAELLAAVEAIPLVAARIETIDEAQHSDVLAPPQSPLEEPRKEIPEVAPPEATWIEDGHLPIQPELEQYFRVLKTPGQARQPGAGSREVHLRIADLSNQAVSGSEAIMAEAWALRRLSESYPKKEMGELQVSSIWLLESMVRDHIEALNREVNQTRSLLDPVLLWILEENSSSQAARSELSGTESTTSTNDPQPSWNTSALMLFGRLERVRELIQGLFASGGLTTSQEEAVGLLWSELSEFETSLNRLEAQVVKGFSEPAKGVSLSQR